MKDSASHEMAANKIDELLSYRLGKSHHQNFRVAEFQVKAHRKCVTRTGVVCKDVWNMPTILWLYLTKAFCLGHLPQLASGNQGAWSVGVKLHGFC
jgi:hypothetical protein